MQNSLTLHSMAKVVQSGTLFLILKSASIVDNMGENSIFPSSAVASSSSDSICRARKGPGSVSQGHLQSLGPELGLQPKMFDIAGQEPPLAGILVAKSEGLTAPP